MSANGTATINLQVILGGNGLAGVSSLGTAMGQTGSMALGLRDAFFLLNDVMAAFDLIQGTAQTGFEFFSGALETATTDAGNLQYSMAQAGIAVQGLGNNTQQLQDEITSLADNGLFSTQQVAEGFVTLGRRGQDAAEILKYTGAQVIYLAEAINSDTVPAALLLSSAMETFHLKGSDAAATANTLTAAFYNSGDSLDQLQQAINQAGAMAAEMKVPFDDFMETLTLLSQAGLRGTQAGTSLRYLLASLPDPTSKAQAELAALGLVVINQTSPAFRTFTDQLTAAENAAGGTAPKFDGTVASLNAMFTAAKSVGLLHTDQTFWQWATQSGILSDKLFTASGQFVGMKQALLDIQNALNKFPPGDIQDRANALEQLFNVRSGQGAMLLTGLDNLAAKWDHLHQVIANTSAESDAQKLVDTFNGSLQRLQTTWTSFMARVGTPIINTVTPWINSVNDALSGLMKNNPQMASWVAIFLVAGAVFTGVGLALLSFIAALVGVIAFLGALAVPTLFIIATVGEGIHVVRSWGAAWSTVGHIIGAVAGFIGGAIGGLLGLLGRFFGGLLGGLGGLIGSLASTVGTQLGRIPALFGSMFSVIGGLVHGVFGAIGNFFLSIVHQIGESFNWLYHHNIYWTELVNGIRMVVGAVAGWLLTIWNSIVHSLAATWEMISVGARSAWATVQHDIQVVWGVIQGAISASVANVQHVVGIAWGIIQAITGTVWKVVHDDTVRAWNSIVSFISGLGGQVGHAASQAMSPVEQFFLGFGQKMYQFGQNLIHMLAQGITAAAGAVIGAAKGIAGGIATILGFHSPAKEGPASDSDTWAPNLVRMFAGGLVAGIPLVSVAARGIASGLAGGINGGSLSSLHTLAASTRSSAGAGGSVTIPIYLDSKQIGQATLSLITGQLQLSGAARLFK